jgi:hypothetical protein
MAVERWRGTEKDVCRALGKRHVGGPGQPDCRGGGEVVEVKHQKRPVNQWQMREIVEKPWAEGMPLIVVSTSGFTPGARRMGNREDVSMFKLNAKDGRRRSRKINPPR